MDLRLLPRISVEGLCGVATRHGLKPATMLDLSSGGIRLECVFDPATASRAVQLEIELPGVDEVMWAGGHVTFARLSPLRGLHSNGQPRFLCRAGIQLDAAATRDVCLLRDYVFETHRARRRAAEVARRAELEALLA